MSSKGTSKTNSNKAGTFRDKEKPVEVRDSNITAAKGTKLFLFRLCARIMGQDNCLESAPQLGYTPVEEYPLIKGYTPV